MITLALNDDWDLADLDSLSNMATKEDNNQIAQDIASSVRVWKGELPFDIERGIEYNKPDEIRGVLNFEIKKQAELIDGVREVSVVFDKQENRELKMTIYATTDSGEVVDVQ